MYIVEVFEGRAKDKMMECFPWDVHSFLFSSICLVGLVLAIFFVEGNVDLLFCLMFIISFIISFISKLIMITSILREDL